MSFNSIIKTDQIKSQLISSNKISFFISYVDFDNLKIFDFRIFLKHKNVSFNRLNTKQINKLINLSVSNDVVLRYDNKNFDLRSVNLSVIFLNNFFIFIYLLNYILQFYKDKIHFLYFKINNFFFTINFFKKNFKNFFINELKYLDSKEFQIQMNYQLLFIMNNFKMLYFKLYFLFKFLFFFKFTKYISKNII